MPTTCGTFDFELRFSLDVNAPKKYHDRWKKFLKPMGRRFHVPPGLLEEWIKDLKKIKANPADMHILNRAESGIGGDDNQTCRQIRPPLHQFQKFHHDHSQTIIFNARPSQDLKTSFWTIEELLAYGSVFQNILSNHVFSHENCIEFDLVVNGFNNSAPENDL